MYSITVANVTLVGFVATAGLVMESHIYGFIDTDVKLHTFLHGV